MNKHYNPTNRIRTAVYRLAIKNAAGGWSLADSRKFNRYVDLLCLDRDEVLAYGREIAAAESKVSA